jgi:purine nucleosidase
LFDHDGGYDDLLSLIMLLCMPHVDLKGIVVTPADCYLRPAVSATLKILRRFGRTEVAVHPGTLPGTNPFPPSWRSASYRINALPILNELEGVKPYETFNSSTRIIPGHEFIAQQLAASKSPVTILVTGPITNVAAALKDSPELHNKVEDIVWMGGALETTGNVRDYEHDGSAEWNVYWDPHSAALLWEEMPNVPLTIFPLDVTDSVPVDLDFLCLRLAKQRQQHPVSDLCGQIWAMTVGSLPSYEFQYHMWDTLTTGSLGAPPHLFKYREVHSRVHVDSPSAGRIEAVTPLSDQKGRKVRVAHKVKVEAFLDYVLNLLRRDF